MKTDTENIEKMHGNEVVNEITIDHIKDMAASLRRLDINWSEKLADQMGVTISKIYDITNERANHQAHRILFIKHGDKLRKKMENRLIGALNVVS